MKKKKIILVRQKEVKCQALLNWEVCQAFLSP